MQVTVTGQHHYLKYECKLVMSLSSSFHFLSKVALFHIYAFNLNGIQIGSGIGKDVKPNSNSHHTRKLKYHPIFKILEANVIKKQKSKIMCNGLIPSRVILAKQGLVGLQETLGKFLYKQSKPYYIIQKNLKHRISAEMKLSRSVEIFQLPSSSGLPSEQPLTTRGNKKPLWLLDLNSVVQ